jgi:hypothetical protein
VCLIRISLGKILELFRYFCREILAVPAPRNLHAQYARARASQRHNVENMFAKLKDWRRVATRYDRCAHTFFSTICIAASVAFYLKERVLSLSIFGISPTATTEEQLTSWPPISSRQA